MRSLLTLMAVMVATNAQAVDVTAGGYVGGLIMNDKHEFYNIKDGEHLSQPLTLSVGLRAGIGLTRWLDIEGEADIGGRIVGQADANVVGLRIGPRLVGRNVIGDRVDIHGTLGFGSLSVLGANAKSGRDTDMVIHAGPGVDVRVTRQISLRGDYRVLGTSHVGSSNTPSFQHLVTLGFAGRLGPSGDGMDAAQAGRRAGEAAGQAAASAGSAESFEALALAKAAEAERAAQEAAASDALLASAEAEATRAHVAAQAARAAADQATLAARQAAELAAELAGIAHDVPEATQASVAAQADADRATAAAASAMRAATEAEASAVGADDAVARVQAATDAEARAEAAALLRAATEQAEGAAISAEASAAQAAVEDEFEELNLEDIRFDSNRATVQAQSIPLLQQIADVLIEHPGVRLVRVEGHTDSSGSAEANLALSQARVDEAVRILVERGVEPERLQAQGFGETQPIADNGTAQGRSQNRRVTFTVVR